MAARKRKTFKPKTPELVRYNGKGGKTVSNGQTVAVRAPASRRGYYVIDVMHQDGKVLPTTVKGSNLSPLGDQLF